MHIENVIQLTCVNACHAAYSRGCTPRADRRVHQLKCGIRRRRGIAERLDATSPLAPNCILEFRVIFVSLSVVEPVVVRFIINTFPVPITMLIRGLRNLLATLSRVIRRVP